MFYSSRDIEVSGMKYENIVFEKLKEAFFNQTVFGINGYPIFSGNGQAHREIDILLAHANLGIFNIEVKGIKITDIETIIGHEWRMIPGFYAEVIQPFSQALKQTYVLKQQMSRKIERLDNVKFITVVALPEITQAEWIGRGFDKLNHLPTPLFKDDLTNANNLIDKITAYTTSIGNTNISNQHWKHIQRFFQVDSLPLVDNPIQRVSSLPVFSKLLIINSIEQLNSARIEEQLNQGIKIYLFLKDNSLRVELHNLKKFEKNYLLEIFILNRKLPELVVENGVLTSKQQILFNKLTEYCQSFNEGQYKAIHADKSSNQIITAGAGTGKTHVMIDRILYLTIVHNVPLIDNIMITFTNKSTSEMRNRLEQRLITLAELTGKSKFLLYAEEVCNMQISTIHSYAKTVIETLAHELGYGKSIKLRSFTHEKNVIIKKLVDQYFENLPKTFFVDNGMNYYEVTDYIAVMWAEFEEKGLSKDDIEKRIDWGDVTEQSKPMADLFKYVFANCEAELDKKKKALNAVTMNDLIRKLKAFTTENTLALKQLKQDCYIFVDEFQDSDNVQIAFIAQLQRIANYKLFVVGDVKQSIYRFRGADYRSFDELKKKISPNVNIDELTLRLNYRSSQELLTEMDKRFMYWGNETPQLLTYSSETRLQSQIKSNYNESWIEREEKSNNPDEQIKENLNYIMQTLDGFENKQVALLVYSNSQVKKLRNICKEMNITTSENLDGTFYTTLAVKHFTALLEGLLYPNEPKFVINALETPYFNIQIEPQHLFVAQGNKDILNKILLPIKNQTITHYVAKLNEHTILSVVQSLILKNEVLHRLQSYFIKQGETEQIAKQQAQHYILNLQHLMLLIEKTFATQHVSLYTLVEWLNLQISTNRTENEPLLNDGSSKVVISTVHRAKGLEFDTVFMPILNEPYDYMVTRVYVEEDINQKGIRKVGWCMKNKSGLYFKNNYFYELNNVENIEQEKEEVRLLYVALTRAKQRVILLMPANARDNTWAKLLQNAGR